MKKMILTLLAALAVATLSTSNPALAAGPACEPSESAGDCLARMQVLAATLAQVNAQCEDEIAAKDRQIADLRAAQASAASAGDGAEVARLQGLLAAKDAEIAELKRERDELRSQVASLQGQVTELSGKFDDLNARLTAFLTEKAEPARSVATAAEPASAAASPGGEARLAVYEPRLDPSVYGRMGWRNDQPQIPDPMAFPDVWWEDAGNCLTVGNEKTDPVNGWVILRIAGITRVVDSTGHVVADEIPLGPGDTYSFCADSEAPRMSITPAMRSTAPSAERHWSDFERQWVPLQRNHSGTYHPHEWFGADRYYDIG